MKKKKNSKKIVFDIPKYLPIITYVLVVTLSATLFFLSKGYRIDFRKKTVTKRGVITVNSRPIPTAIYIDGDLIGRTSKSKAVDTGIHNVVLKREKYHKWEKDVRVLPETTTLITPWMLLAEPQKNIVWETKKEYVRHWISKEKNSALILLKEEDETYSLWRYRIQGGVLNMFDKPNKIWSLTHKEFEILLSPNGNYALLTILQEGQKTTYLINTTSQFVLETSESINLAEGVGDKIQWAKDNKHLLLISKKDILSYNINSQMTYSLISKKNEKGYIWDTDRNGTFYILKNLSKQDDDVYTYSIEKYDLDGTGESYLISNISLQKDERYIEYYRKNLFNYIPFTNSVINTQTVGEISSFVVNTDISGVFITTTSASYWYDIASRTYVMVNPYPSELMEFSKNNRHFLLHSNDSLYTFTFEKYSENPVEKTGLTEFKNAKKDHSVAWVDNSKYYSYIKENTLHITEKDGDNDVVVIPMENTLFYNIESSRDNVTVFEKDKEGKFVISEYRI